MTRRAVWRLSGRSSDSAPAVGAGWRETLTVAADLAVVGFAVTLLALPVVTLGAAVRAGSVAARAIAVDGGGFDLRGLWRVFVRSLLPGFVATVAVCAVAGFIVVDFGAVGGGRVPGGYPVLAALGVTAAITVAVCGLTVARLGHDRDGSWLGALRWAARAAGRQPVAVAAVAGVLTVAAAIGVMVPFTAPILVGYALYALHVLAGRFAPPA